ncbi:MAG TPA: 3-dehydroquinate synthase [Firmicutes bacterium]|nr:3-dehydroquinate synthase [Bacillota bacterium]
MGRLKVTLPGAFTYEISIGDGIWREVEDFAKGFSKVFIVTDENVENLYGKRLPFPRFVMPPGEGSKTWRQAELLLKQMSRADLDRQSLIIALGGGVVGDLAGFAASIFLRGIAYSQIPTTLLAQVDSAVGGKTAVNLPWGKNLIGSFHQPRAVFIDPAVLKTLDKREITSGLGEVLKYGVIAGPKFFSDVTANLEGVYNADPKVCGPIIRQCLEIKSEIVRRDEHDLGLRKILNFGHTFGHALEAAADFTAYKHGEGVLNGMLLEARLSFDLGILPRKEYEKIKTGLEKVELKGDFKKPPFGKIKGALLKDKKNRRGQISFILPKRLGEMEEVFLGVKEVGQWWQKI